MDDTGTGTRLPRSTSVNVSRRALMRSAAATLVATAVAGIVRPAFAQRGPVRTLLKGGVVLSFDPAVGDFEKADVLIEDKKIVAVRPDISADATAIDASRMIVLPGFIDTHHHFYQSALRNVLANGVLADYFRDISGAATNHYRPEDAYIGNLTGALRSLDAGITTITDLSQVSNTPEHSDALIKGLTDSGIRAIYAYSRGSGAGAKSEATAATRSQKCPRAPRRTPPVDRRLLRVFHRAIHRRAPRAYGSCLADNHDVGVVAPRCASLSGEEIA